MAGFDHGPQHPREVEDPAIAARNARYGMILFLIYLATYAAFVGLNAVTPRLMDVTVVGGLNLAIVYGMALIVLAMVLALVYSWLCRSRTGASPTPNA